MWTGDFGFEFKLSLILGICHNLPQSATARRYVLPVNQWECFDLTTMCITITSIGGGFAAPRIRNVEHGGLVTISGRSPRLLLCILIWCCCVSAAVYLPLCIRRCVSATLYLPLCLLCCISTTVSAAVHLPLCIRCCESAAVYPPPCI